MERSFRTCFQLCGDGIIGVGEECECNDGSTSCRYWCMDIVDICFFNNIGIGVLRYQATGATCEPVLAWINTTYHFTIRNQARVSWFTHAYVRPRHCTNCKLDPGKQCTPDAIDYSMGQGNNLEAQVRCASLTIKAIYQWTIFFSMHVVSPKSQIDRRNGLKLTLFQLTWPQCLPKSIIVIP